VALNLTFLEKKVSILDGCQSAEDIRFMDIHDFTSLMGMIIARTSNVGDDPFNTITLILAHLS